VTTETSDSGQKPLSRSQGKGKRKVEEERYSRLVSAPKARKKGDVSHRYQEEDGRRKGSCNPSRETGGGD